MKWIIAAVVAVVLGGGVILATTGGEPLKLFDRTVPENVRGGSSSPPPRRVGVGAPELWAAMRGANPNAPWIGAVERVLVDGSEVRIDTPYTLDGRGKSLAESICAAAAAHAPEGVETIVVTGAGGQQGATCKPD